MGALTVFACTAALILVVLAEPHHVEKTSGGHDDKSSKGNGGLKYFGGERVGLHYGHGKQVRGSNSGFVKGYGKSRSTNKHGDISNEGGWGGSRFGYRRDGKSGTGHVEKRKIKLGKANNPDYRRNGGAWRAERFWSGYDGGNDDKRGGGRKMGRLETSSGNGSNRVLETGNRGQKDNSGFVERNGKSGSTYDHSRTSNERVWKKRSGRSKKRANGQIGTANYEASSEVGRGERWNGSGISGSRGGKSGAGDFENRKIKYHGYRSSEGGRTPGSVESGYFSGHAGKRGRSRKIGGLETGSSNGRYRRFDTGTKGHEANNKRKYIKRTKNMNNRQRKEHTERLERNQNTDAEKETDRTAQNDNGDGTSNGHQYEYEDSSSSYLERNQNKDVETETDRTAQNNNGDGTSNGREYEDEDSSIQNLNDDNDDENEEENDDDDRPDYEKKDSDLTPKPKSAKNIYSNDIENSKTKNSTTGKTSYTPANGGSITGSQEYQNRQEASSWSQYRDEHKQHQAKSINQNRSWSYQNVGNSGDYQPDVGQYPSSVDENARDRPTNGGSNTDKKTRSMRKAAYAKRQQDSSWSQYQDEQEENQATIINQDQSWSNQNVGNSGDDKADVGQYPSSVDETTRDRTTNGKSVTGSQKYQKEQQASSWSQYQYEQKQHQAKSINQNRSWSYQNVGNSGDDKADIRQYPSGDSSHSLDDTDVTETEAAEDTDKNSGWSGETSGESSQNADTIDTDCNGEDTSAEGAADANQQAIDWSQYQDTRETGTGGKNKNTGGWAGKISSQPNQNADADNFAAGGAGNSAGGASGVNQQQPGYGNWFGGLSYGGGLDGKKQDYGWNNQGYSGNNQGFGGALNSFGINIKGKVAGAASKVDSIDKKTDGEGGNNYDTSSGLSDTTDA